MKQARDLTLKPRQKLLREMRTRFIAQGYPRVVMTMILALAGLVAFAFSALALSLGLDHMGLRYLAATIAGYATFLLLIRAWIGLHRIGWHVDLPIPDLFGIGPDNDPAQSTFGGGRSGGAGAAGSWESPSSAFRGVDADVDEGWPVLLGVAFLLGGLLAMLYVVYTAPVLLAEVALDAALVTGIYRKLRKEDMRHWLDSAFRHTWLPAVVAAICLYAMGAVFQRAMPDARSIGDVVRELRN